MPFSVLLLVVAFSLFPAMFSLIDGDDVKMRWRLFWWTVFLVSVGWMIGSISRPWKVEREEVVDYSEITLPNGTAVQVLNFLDRYGKPQAINLNETFKTRLTIASKVKIKHNSFGPYCGVYYGGTTLAHDDFEIVCSMPDNKKE